MVPRNQGTEGNACMALLQLKKFGADFDVNLEGEVQVMVGTRCTHRSPCLSRTGPGSSGGPVAIPSLIHWLLRSVALQSPHDDSSRKLRAGKERGLL